MVQHKMKQKVTLPKGTKQKVKKAPPKGPKRGHHTFIAPKKKSAVEEAKVSAEVTRVINQRNEEMLKERADRDVGRIKSTNNDSSSTTTTKSSSSNSK